MAVFIFHSAHGSIEKAEAQIAICSPPKSQVAPMLALRKSAGPSIATGLASSKKNCQTPLWVMSAASQFHQELVPSRR